MLDYEISLIMFIRGKCDVTEETKRLGKVQTVMIKNERKRRKDELWQSEKRWERREFGDET